MSARKSASSTVWKWLVGIAAALIIVILVAEFGLRWFMGNQMTKEFEQTTQAEGLTAEGEPSVSFGSSPLLLGMLGGKIPSMEMHTPSTLLIEGDQIKGQPQADVHIEGMTLADDPVADSLRATTTIPDDFLLVTFQNGIREESGMDQLGNIAVSDITANGQEGILDVDMAGGIVGLALRPYAQDGALAIEATKSTLFGYELPDQATNAISEALSQGLKDQFVGDLQMDNVIVEDGFLKLTVAGTNIPLSEIGQQYGATEDAISAPASEAPAA